MNVNLTEDVGAPDRGRRRAPKASWAALMMHSIMLECNAKYSAFVLASSSKRRFLGQRRGFGEWPMGEVAEARPCARGVGGSDKTWTPRAAFINLGVPARLGAFFLLHLRNGDF